MKSQYQIVGIKTYIGEVTNLLWGIKFIFFLNHLL